MAVNASTYTCRALLNDAGDALAVGSSDGGVVDDVAGQLSSWRLSNTCGCVRSTHLFMSTAVVCAAHRSKQSVSSGAAGRNAANMTQRTICQLVTRNESFVFALFK